MSAQRLLESLSFFVLVCVVMLRPLIAESYDSAGNAMTAALGQVSEPSPVRTLFLDVLILLGTGGWLLARAMGPVRRYRWTGIELGAVLVACAAVVSCVFAGNKRLAINASLDWLCLPLLAICLVQLMYRPEHRWLLLAVILASACVQAFQCFEQMVDGFETTWNHYQAMKGEFWARQGVPLDSDTVELFEQRMRAWEAHGFLQHSNVTGAYLVLCGFVAAGWTLAGWRMRCHAHRLIAAGGALVTMFLFAAAYFTRSLGALVSAIAGIIIWIIVHTFASWIISHRRKAFLIGWSCVIVGAFATVGYGLYRGSLPNTSLNFRWQYWRASTDLMADHLWTGVGRENFGRHYLKYKPIESPEEISNPHNLFVQAASDWGVIGLAGMVVMIVGGSWVLIRIPASEPGAYSGATTGRPVPATRPVIPAKAGIHALRDRGESDASEGGRPHTPFHSVRSLFLWSIGLLAVLVLGRLPLLGTTDRNFLYYSSLTTVLVWLPSFLLLSLPRTPRRPAIAAVVATGAAVGMLTFLVHDLISFAMFVPGSATTFFALFAFCIGERPPWTPGRHSERSEESCSEETVVQRRTRCFAALSMTPLESVSITRRWIPVAGVAAGMWVTLWIALIPVTRVDRLLSYARRAAARPNANAAEVDAYFLQAAAADPYDPTPCAARSRWLAAEQDTLHPAPALQKATEAITAAITRDPYHAGLRRQKMQLYRAQAAVTGRADHHQAAVDAAREAPELYPLDPESIAALADCEAGAGRALASDSLLQSALAHYQRALSVDDARPEWERIRGFSPRQRREIENKIMELGNASLPSGTNRD